MSADKQEIDRIINEIICTGNYWANKFGMNGSNIGGFVAGIDAGRFTPPSWPKFDANWMSNEFYIGALKTEHLHEWLEHLFNLKRGEPEPDMFSFAWRKAKVCGIDGIFHSGFDIAKFVLDNEPIPPRDKWTMTINTAKSLTPRTIKIIRDTENEHGFSWEWVE
jgi:hypothetical protein